MLARFRSQRVFSIAMRVYASNCSIKVMTQWPPLSSWFNLSTIRKHNSLIRQQTTTTHKNDTFQQIIKNNTQYIDDPNYVYKMCDGLAVKLAVKLAVNLAVKLA